jgi:hypothetical protein
MAGLARTTVWRRDDNVLTRETSRSMLLSTPRAVDTVKLEGAAVVVWSELVNPASDDQLVDTIATRLAVPGDEVRANILAGRVALSDLGAIVESDE